MDETTDAFIRVFEELKNEVNRRAGLPSSRGFEIERGCERHGSIKNNRSRLIYIRELRNTLAHPQHRSKGPAIRITESFLNEVQDLVRNLKNPPTANALGVARSKMVVAALDNGLGDLAREMKARGFSHLPILDSRGAVIGVFNEAAVFDHLWAESETIISRNMKVADILNHCQLDAEHTEVFRFVRPLTAVDDLISIFLGVASPTTRIGAVFVTASGNQHEPLQRLITPWDVLASASE